MFLGPAIAPRHWEQTDVFDITRRSSGHVGFGSAIHQCIGQLLARLEGECVLSALRPQGRGDRDHRPAAASLKQHIARIGQPAGEGTARVATIHRDS
jgi:cytochrome P450